MRDGPTMPCWNNNGTSFEELRNCYVDQYMLLIGARNYIAENPPQGRDYQTLPDGTFQRACEEHNARIRKLDQIISELLCIATDITNKNLDRELKLNETDPVNGYDGSIGTD